MYVELHGVWKKVEIDGQVAKSRVLYIILSKRNSTEETFDSLIAQIHLTRINHIPIPQNFAVVNKNCQVAADIIERRWVHGQDVLKIIVPSENQTVYGWGIIFNQSRENNQKSIVIRDIGENWQKARRGDGSDIDGRRWRRVR